MHSSRMRTGRSLTVSRSLLPGEGCLLGWVSALGGGGWLLWGVCSWGVSASRGVCLLRQDVCFGGGVCFWGDVCSQVGVCSQGGLLPGGVCSGGCLLPGVSTSEGVCFWGDVCSRGCLPRGVRSQGVSASGGCLLLGGVGIPACTEVDTPLLTESQT